MKTLIRKTCVVILAASAWAGTAQAVGVPGQGTWESTLKPRDLNENLRDGAEAYYDSVLDITWLKDMNYAKDRLVSSTGLMNGIDANSWVNTLALGRYRDWRLPTVRDIDNDGCGAPLISGGDCGQNVDTTVLAEPGVDSEMAHLFYVTLGHNIDVFASGNQLTNTGPFENLQADIYWSGTETRRSSEAWYFETDFGWQQFRNKSALAYAMVVTSGDIGTPITTVPEPHTYAMLLAGLGVLAVVVRRRQG